MEAEKEPPFSFVEENQKVSKFKIASFAVGAILVISIIFASVYWANSGEKVLHAKTKQPGTSATFPFPLKQEDDKTVGLFNTSGNPEYFELILSGKLTAQDLPQDAQNLTDKNGYNGLHYAASLLAIETMKVLLSAGGFDVNMEAKVDGMTALHLVAKTADPVLSIEATQLLLNHGAQIDYENNTSSVLDLAFKNNSPLFRFLADKVLETEGLSQRHKTRILRLKLTLKSE